MKHFKLRSKELPEIERSIIARFDGTYSFEYSCDGTFLYVIPSSGFNSLVLKSLSSLFLCSDISCSIVTWDSIYEILCLRISLV